MRSKQFSKARRTKKMHIEEELGRQYQGVVLLASSINHIFFFNLHVLFRTSLPNSFSGIDDFLQLFYQLLSPFRRHLSCTFLIFVVAFLCLFTTPLFLPALSFPTHCASYFSFWRLVKLHNQFCSLRGSTIDCISVSHNKELILIYHFQAEL